MTETYSPQGQFKNRSDLHLARKVWHMSSVFMMFVAWMVLPYWASMALLVSGWLLFVPSDILRLKNPNFNKSVTGLFRPIMRTTEINKLAGTTYLISGTLLIALVFDKSIVAMSLLFLAFADPIASFVGIKYGKDKIFGHKSVQGFVAAFIVCAISSYLFLFYFQVPQQILIVSLVAGLIGACAELIPVAKIDDNFTMPVFTSIGLSIVFYFFDYYPFLASL